MATQDEKTKDTGTSTLKEKFQGQLDLAKQRLEKAKQDIANLKEEDKESIRKTRDEIQQRIQAQQERGKEVRSQIAGWMADKKQQTDEQITSWRQRREIKHLQRRADRAAEYAVNLVEVAIMDAEDAEMAVLDALDARLDADNASTPV